MSFSGTLTLTCDTVTILILYYTSREKIAKPINSLIKNILYKGVLYRVNTLVFFLKLGLLLNIYLYHEQNFVSSVNTKRTGRLIDSSNEYKVIILMPEISSRNKNYTA